MILYVYVLKSFKDKKLYIGKTKDLERRLLEHRKGRVKATRSRRPLELVYYEVFINRTDWTKEELFLKSGIGRENLKHRLKKTIE